MKLTKYVTAALGAAALTTMVVATAAPASATPVPPTASAALNGTWVNTNAKTNSVKQIVVAPVRGGNVSVDAFGVCHPTLCEWGRVPATVFAPNVSTTVGTTFRSNQRFLTGKTEWSRTALYGKVTKAANGLQLVVREMTVFEDGSGRHNYQRVETFARGKGQSVKKLGMPVNGFPVGAPPAASSSLLGSWTNPTADGNLAGIKITGTISHPVVQASGQCTPTACDWGQVKAIAYGDTISSTGTNTVLAPFTFNFKTTELIITLKHTSTGDQLTVNEYNEFSDGSGRSNYATTETLVRV